MPQHSRKLPQQAIEPAFALHTLGRISLILAAIIAYVVATTLAVIALGAWCQFIVEPLFKRLGIF